MTVENDCIRCKRVQPVRPVKTNPCVHCIDQFPTLQNAAWNFPQKIWKSNYSKNGRKVETAYIEVEGDMSNLDAIDLLFSEAWASCRHPTGRSTWMEYRSD